MGHPYLPCSRTPQRYRTAQSSWRGRDCLPEWLDLGPPQPQHEGWARERGSGIEAAIACHRRHLSAPMTTFVSWARPWARPSLRSQAGVQRMGGKQRESERAYHCHLWSQVVHWRWHFVWVKRMVVFDEVTGMSRLTGGILHPYARMSLVCPGSGRQWGAPLCGSCARVRRRFASRCERCGAVAASSPPCDGPWPPTAIPTPMRFPPPRKNRQSRHQRATHTDTTVAPCDAIPTTRSLRGFSRSRVCSCRLSVTVWVHDDIFPRSRSPQ